MHIGVEIFQYLNDMEELRDGRRVLTTHGEELRRKKRKGAQVAERLICRWDGRQAYPRVCPQVIYRGQPVIHLLLQEKSIQSHAG